jgi:hypothetical protein
MAAPTLSYYQNGVLRLTNERPGIYYGKTDDPNELNDYINEARRRVAFDAKLYRRMEPITFTEGQIAYSIPTITGVLTNFSLFRIYVTNGGVTYPLSQLSYTDLRNKWLNSNIRSAPQAWSHIDQLSFRIGPVPNQAYNGELDLVTLPDDLVDPMDIDTITFPYADCVKYWAAYLAYAKDKGFIEADNMIRRYVYEMSENVGDAVHVIAAARFTMDYNVT